MKKKKKIEASISVTIPYSQKAMEIETPLNKALRGEFGKDTMIGGAGVGFGERDYSIYTSIKNLPRVYKFVGTFLRKRGFKPRLSVSYVFVAGERYEIEEFEEEFGVTVRY